VLCDGGRHRDGADRERLADLELHDVREAAPANERRETVRDHDRRDAPELLERGDVEVVVVRV